MPHVRTGALPDMYASAVCCCVSCTYAVMTFMVVGQLRRCSGPGSPVGRLLHDGALVAGVEGRWCQHSAAWWGFVSRTQNVSQVSLLVVEQLRGLGHVELE